jgi:hypothetical protein
VKLKERIKLILRSLSILVQPESLVEVRAFRADGAVLAGIFDELQKLAREAALAL